MDMVRTPLHGTRLRRVNTRNEPKQGNIPTFIFKRPPWTAEVKLKKNGLFEMKEMTIPFLRTNWSHLVRMVPTGVPTLTYIVLVGRNGPITLQRCPFLEKTPLRPIPPTTILTRPGRGPLLTLTTQTRAPLQVLITLRASTCSHSAPTAPYYRSTKLYPLKLW